MDAEITASQNMYNEKQNVPFSDAESLALITQRENLNAMIEEFKLAIDATTIVDIDFGTQESPTKINVITEIDTTGVTNYLFTITGIKGTMIVSNASGTADDGTVITATAPFELGYNATDSLGMLRVGTGEATVNFKGAPVKETDIVNIKFDYYYGNLQNRKAGYKVLTAEGDTICGLYCSTYSGDNELNTFNINYQGNITNVGGAGNGLVAASSNKTSFDIVLDYGAQTMYCTTSGSKGTVISETFALTKGAPSKFVIYSNYGNADQRRCWFDNLKIQNIAAGAPDAIDAVEIVKAVTNNAMYNLMGQQIKRANKGQIYIQNGQKKIGK